MNKALSAVAAIQAAAFVASAATTADATAAPASETPPPDLPNPVAGGSYLRDPITGALSLNHAFHAPQSE